MVPLPGDISIKSLAFQFAPKPGAKENAALTRGLIALGRLDTAGRWPDVIPLDKLKSEIPAYEATYKKIREQSLAGRLEIPAVVNMDNALKSLKLKIGVTVPVERGFRAEAMKFVDNLIGATKMFDASTLGFAREMIADTSKHEAHTVGELLAFMRKYRLLFARADAAPGGDEMYGRLYSLLRQQADELGLEKLKPSSPVSIATPMARIMDGNWAIEGNDLIQTSFGMESMILLGDSSWSSYDVNFEFMSVQGREGFYVFFHYADAGNFIKLYTGGFGNSIHGVISMINGQPDLQAERKAQGRIEFQKWHSIRLVIRGGDIKAYIDNQQIMHYTDNRLTAGKFAIGSNMTSVRFRNIRVRAVDGNVLFKGVPRLSR